MFGTSLESVTIYCSKRHEYTGKERDPQLVESWRDEENYTTLHNISQSKKEVSASKKGRKQD